MASHFPSHPTLEERIRRAHAGRAYLMGTIIGNALAAFARLVLRRRGSS
jgi:hypothetical protein